MDKKVIIGLGLAALAAYLLLKKKKPVAAAPAAQAPAAPAASAPQVKSADKRVFVDDAPSPTEPVTVAAPERSVEEVMAQKQAIALQSIEDVIVPSVEPVPASPAVVYGGTTFYDSGFTQQMTDSMSKDFDFYSNQKVLAEAGSMDMTR